MINKSISESISEFMKKSISESFRVVSDLMNNSVDKSSNPSVS